MTGGDHYATLGVGPDADAVAIRDAYRTLARRFHPDRGPVDDGAMAAVNEAYRVLGEPSRRAVYDAARRGTGSAVVGSSGRTSQRVPTVPVPAPVAPEARYPWKLVTGMFLLGATVVLVGAALYEPARPAPPDNVLGPGSCVVVGVDQLAQEANCTGVAGELVVTVLVSGDERCPDGTSQYRDRQGMGVACVTAASVP